MHEISKLDNPQKCIELKDIILDYPLRTNNQGSIKGIFSLQTYHKPVRSTFRALNGVNLDVYHGDILGIIGENGAGKSTLLKLLAKIIKPTSGVTKIWGDVFPLLTIGAGFHPDLTGIENIYLYSAVLGRGKKTVEDKLDWIIGQADLHEFINQPISTYSKGMIARLGFFTIMSESPDILLADEVLGVGDERFREKCNLLLRNAYTESTTSIIVSHSMPMLQQFCNRIIWIKDKKIFLDGKPKYIIQEYHSYMTRQG